MTGNQHSCHFTQQNQPKLSGKKIDYLSSSLLAPLKTHGSASDARLQREELSRSKQRS
jgi:hypothetical protein